MKRLLKIEMVIVLSFLLLVMSFHAEDRKGSIDLYFHGSHQNEEVIRLQNVPFVIYRIAKYQNQEYIVDDLYKDLDLSFDDIFTSSQTEMSKQINDYIEKYDIQGEVYYTNDSGHIYFQDLDLGVYFIVQKEGYQYQDGVFVSSPFLINIPMNDRQQMIYHLRIEPKSEWFLKSQENNQGSSLNHSSQQTKTSDDEDLFQYIFLLGLSLFIFVFEYLLLKKDKDMKL